jgi:hypothetical protein
MNQSMRVLTSQATDEWYTPAWIIDLARECLGAIDLDPASSAEAQRTVQAAAYYDGMPMSGLAQPWAGRVWLNPPFSDTPRWVAHWRTADIDAGLLLVNSAPGYSWWEELWREQPVCMLRQRVRFVRADGADAGQAKKGQTIAYRGPYLRRFIDLFRLYGRIILP